LVPEEPRACLKPNLPSEPERRRRSSLASSVERSVRRSTRLGAWHVDLVCALSCCSNQTMRAKPTTRIGASRSAVASHGSRSRGRGQRALLADSEPPGPSHTVRMAREARGSTLDDYVRTSARLNSEESRRRQVVFAEAYSVAAQLMALRLKRKIT